jgi:hypothetical protein
MGSFEMSVFQMLFAGKTWQLVVGGADAPTGRSAESPAAVAVSATRVIRARLRPMVLSKTCRPRHGNHHRVTAS